MRTEKRLLATTILLAAALLGPAAASSLVVGPAVPSRSELSALRARQPERVLAAQARVQDLRADLGLGSSDGFTTRMAFTNGQGQAIVHLDQTHEGHRVWGARAIAHVLPDGTVRTLTGGVQRSVVVTGTPRITAERATSIALANLAPRGAMPDAPRVELVVFPAASAGGLSWTRDGATGRMVLDRSRVVYAKPAGAFVWAYEIRTRLHNREDGARELVYVVDATTGNLLRVHDALQRLDGGATPAVATGTGLYRGTVSLDAARLADGTYALYDPTRGTLPNPQLESVTGIVGVDPASGWSATGLQAWYDEHLPDGTPTYFSYLFQSNPTNVWGDGLPFTSWGQESGANGQTAAVDALRSLTDTWDFYQAVFGWNGMDGRGTSAFVNVLVNDSYGIDNAWWSTWANGAFLGSGSWPANPSGLASLTELDVVAHEMTHGVSGATAMFVNAPGFEEAGLSEATSDFFAQMVKAWVARDAGAPAGVIPNAGADWTVGRGAGRGTPIRWMDRPSRDERSVDAWYHGIDFMDGHFSAGPVNRALYFLAQGASPDPSSPGHSPYLPEGMSGIGNDAAARIWFKTVTERLHGDGTGTLTMLSARDEAIAAARDLFPADASKAAAVEKAFAAVNVGNVTGKPTRVEVLFADWRGDDYIDVNHANRYANREIFPKHETVRMRVTVRNTADTAVAWSLGGPSVFNGADSWVTKGGVLHEDGSWTTPNQMGWHAITATSHADPLQYAEGRVFLIEMDHDMDGEQDAIDMGSIAFSWYLPQALNPAHSVFEAPWVDDGDVSFFVDAMRSTWPVK